MRSKKARDHGGEVSERTLRRWKKNGLRYAKVDGVDLFKPEWIDEFIESFEIKQNEAKNKAEAIFKNLKPKSNNGK